MAANFTFDPDDVSGMIEAIVDTFDFTMPGEAGGTLGRDMAERVALGIAERSAQGLDPDGQPWAPNSDVPFRGMPGYATYKREKYGVDRPGELGGQMLSQVSLLGSPAVASNEVEMNYGRGETPRSPGARNGVALKPRELAATDTQKAGWFTDGGRRFYELDDAISASVIEVAAEALGRHVEAAGG